MKYKFMSNLAVSILLIGAMTIVRAQDYADYSGCKATVDLKTFDDKIRVTNQTANSISPETNGFNLEFVLVDLEGTKLGDAVSFKLGINQSITLSIKDIFDQANAPKPWKLYNNVIHVIELEGNIAHNMQGTVSYFNGVVPLIFTCVGTPG